MLSTLANDLILRLSNRLSQREFQARLRATCRSLRNAIPKCELLERLDIFEDTKSTFPQGFVPTCVHENDHYIIAGGTNGTIMLTYEKVHEDGQEQLRWLWRWFSLSNAYINCITGFQHTFGDYEYHYVIYTERTCDKLYAVSYARPGEIGIAEPTMTKNVTLMEARHVVDIKICSNRIMVCMCTNSLVVVGSYHFTMFNGKPVIGFTLLRSYTSYQQHNSRHIPTAFPPIVLDPRIFPQAEGDRLIPAYGVPGTPPLHHHYTITAPLMCFRPLIISALFRLHR